MSDQPPPLPVTEDEEILSRAKPVVLHVAPPPAPMLWRSLAFLVDVSVIGMIGWLITSRILVPAYRGDEMAVTSGWFSEIVQLFKNSWTAALNGHPAQVEAIQNEMRSKVSNTPEGVLSLLSFFSSCMTFIYWLGFAGMEIGTGGASLGKKIFKLRTATFPGCERPGVFDSMVRSGWKALAVGSMNPFVAVFAVVDAHWPLFHPLRRTLHDLMSRTLVLDARFEKPAPKKPRDHDED